MSFNKKTIEDIDVKGKKVLVRCDFNVPLNEGKITDENRLNGALPTIKYLESKGAKVILCSHLGKDASKSLKPVAERLSEMLNKEVKFPRDEEVVGANAKKAVAEMKDGDIILLENTRARKEETKNIESFSKELASLADIFVNDAFGTAHRAHCSTVGVTEYLDTAVCGYLIQKELKFLGEAVNAPVRPFVAILGGSKVSDKIAVINNLLEKVDTIIIGGGMAYTFLNAKGYNVGTSLLEADKVELAKEFMERGKDKLVLPVDTVVANDFSNPTEIKTVASSEIPDGFMGLDIGEKTIELFKKELEGAKTVVWNGPMGVFEDPRFAKGTEAVCTILAELPDAMTVIGGGDSAAAAISMGFADKFTHISTGGGASLEYMEGKELPGIAIIQEKA